LSDFILREKTGRGMRDLIDGRHRIKRAEKRNFDKKNV
jgi:hypothetical protein